MHSIYKKTQVSVWIRLNWHDWLVFSVISDISVIMSKHKLSVQYPKNFEITHLKKGLPLSPLNGYPNKLPLYELWHFALT